MAPWVFMGGFLDGVNPCAFSVMVFFGGYLISNRSSKIYFLAGFSFIFGIFLTYFALGLGGYVLLQHLCPFLWVKRSFDVLVAAIAGVVGVFSLIDAFLPPEKMFLRLSPDQNRGIHHRIVNTLHHHHLPITAFFLGVTVAIMEALCTGQIYLPVLYTLVRFNGEAALLSLLLYNLCFILPLVFVLFLVFCVKEVRWTASIKPVKVAMGVFLLAMSIMLLKGGCIGCQADHSIGNSGHSSPLP